MFYLLFRIFFMIAITLLLLTFRLKLMIKQPVFNKEDNPHSFVDNFLLRVGGFYIVYSLSQYFSDFSLIATYLLLTNLHRSLTMIEQN